MVGYPEIRFGPFRLDPLNACLWQGTRRHSLTPKDFSVLYCLAARSGDLVTKTELMKKVWPDTAVGDDVLKTCIRRLRIALEDDYVKPQYIQTVHRRGYRFVCPIQTKQAEISQTAPQTFMHHLMVGRAKELKRLDNLLEQARMGTRQTVFLSGEAGIGKTTLVNAFCRRTRKRRNVLVIEGQCIEIFGTGEPYRPILEALGRLCRTDECSLVISVMKRHGPLWLLQMPWLLSRDEIMDLQKLSVGTTPDRMLRELAESLEIVSNEIPLVLIIEDLHWSDAATLDALNVIAQRKTLAQLMVIGTFRPEELPTRDHPLNRIVADLILRGHAIKIPLELLSEGDLEKLLVRRYPDRIIPEGFIEWLYRHSEGNPLFINALLDHAENRGWITDEGVSAYPISKNGYSTLTVPETLRQLIENNLSQISKVERDVVEAGSVVGTTFPVKILADSAEEEEKVDSVCNQLVRRKRLLCTTGLMDWPDGTNVPCYSFIHSLHQQVIYDTIPPLRNRRLHLQIGNRLEKAHSNQIANVAASLAMHFDRALEYKKAVIYSQRAGEVALERHAYQEVAVHMNRGLRLLQMMPDKPERGRIEITLRIMLGTTLVATQGYGSPQVEGVYSRAHELCLKSEAHPQFMPVLFGLWMYYLAKADVEKAKEVGEYYFQIATQTEKQTHLVWAHTVRGLTNWYQGKLPEAMENAEICVSCYEPKQQQVLVQQHGVDAGLLSWGHKAMTLCVMGFPDRACEEGQKALAVAQESSGPFMIASVLAYTSSLYIFRRELPLLKSFTGQLVSLATEHGIAYWMSLAGVLQGWRLGIEGHYKEGIAQITELMASYKATGAKLMLNYFQYLLADVHRIAGQATEGLQVLNKAIEFTNITKIRWIEGELYRLMGDLYLLKSAKPSRKKETYTEEAQACFMKALEIANKQQAKLFELRAAVGLSRVLRIRGNQAESLLILRKTYEWFREGFELQDLKEAKAMIVDLSRG